MQSSGPLAQVYPVIKCKPSFSTGKKSLLHVPDVSAGISMTDGPPSPSRIQVMVAHMTASGAKIR